MKRFLRLLNYLQRKHDLTQFYSVSATEFGIDLQGNYSSVLVRELMEYACFKMEINKANGYTIFESKTVRICLT